MKNRTMVIIAAVALLAATALILGCGTFGEGFLIPVGEETAPKFVFVKNQWDGTVAAFTVNPTTGALTAVTGSPFDIGDCCSASLDADPTSRFVYVPVSADSLVVLGVNQSTGALTPVSGSPFDIGDCNLQFIKADPSGRFVYATDNCLKRVFALSISASGVPTNVPGSPVLVGSCPHGIAVDSQTRFVYVTDRCNGSIYGFTISATTGELTAMAGSPFPATEGSLRFAAIDRSDHFLYVADEGADQVLAFSINQTTGVLSSAGAVDTDCGPVGISASPKFDLVAVANWCEDSGTTVSVFSINTSTGALTHVPDSPFDVTEFTGGGGINDLAFDPSGKFIYGTAPFSGDAGQVLGFAIDATGTGTPITGSPFTQGLNDGVRLAITH